MKPVYSVPTMRDIAAIPLSGLKAVSTFSGGGGSCTGYRMAGFEVVWANEFIPAAQETYRANHPGTYLDTRDIRDIDPADILKVTGLGIGELDLLDGSPPCSAFSMSGKREAGWGKVNNYSDSYQRTDDLFFEYVRLVNGLKPKVFIAENVSGLVKGTAKGYFLEILKELKACGYRVRAKLLDASWLGVPQARERLIFIGVRNDLDLEPQFPKPLPYRYTLADALAGVTGPVEPEASMAKYAVGREWLKLAPGKKSEKYLNLVRPELYKPCPTITQRGGDSSAASVTHPTENRKFSIAELKRICAFPDDYILTGNFGQKWERLGRAVPPLMMKAIAETVDQEVLRKYL